MNEKDLHLLHTNTLLHHSNNSPLSTTQYQHTVTNLQNYNNKGENNEHNKNIFKPNR